MNWRARPLPDPSQKECAARASPGFAPDALPASRLVIGRPFPRSSVLDLGPVTFTALMLALASRADRLLAAKSSKIKKLFRRHERSDFLHIKSIRRARSSARASSIVALGKTPSHEFAICLACLVEFVIEQDRTSEGMLLHFGDGQFRFAAMASLLRSGHVHTTRNLFAFRSSMSRFRRLMPGFGLSACHRAQCTATSVGIFYSPLTFSPGCQTHSAKPR